MRTSDRGMQNFVMNELMVPDAGGFRSFLWMTPNQFLELLRNVEPLIQRSETIMRDTRDGGAYSSLSCIRDISYLHVLLLVA